MSHPLDPTTFEGNLRRTLVSYGVPVAVAERVSIKMETHISPITVRVTLQGAPGWERSCPLKAFPTLALVNEILMLA